MRERHRNRDKNSLFTKSGQFLLSYFPANFLWLLYYTAWLSFGTYPRFSSMLSTLTITKKLGWNGQNSTYKIRCFTPLRTPAPSLEHWRFLQITIHGIFLLYCFRDQNRKLLQSFGNCNVKFVSTNKTTFWALFRSHGLGWQTCSRWDREIIKTQCI